MLVVILGAGASHDSVDTDLDPQLKEVAPLWQPPLARNLFDSRPHFSEVLARFGDCIPIINRVRRAQRDEELLEDVLKQLQDEADEYPIRYRQLLAIQCYLQAIINDCTERWCKSAHGVTHYAELIDEIERWRYGRSEPVAYVTFNYDRMLEAHLGPPPGWNPKYLSDYIDRNDFWLLKLHGSVNWSRIVERSINVTPMDLEKWLWGHAGRYKLGPILLRDGPEGVSTYENDAGLVPALAIPIQDKHSFECPDEHLERLPVVVREARKVISIGWRGAEKHFLDHWRRRNDQYDLLIVAGSRDAGQETYSNMSAGGMSGSARTIHDGGFGSVFETGALRNFLWS